MKKWKNLSAAVLAVGMLAAMGIYTCTNCKISQPSKTKQTRLVHQQ